MNCKKIRKQILLQPPEGELPPELRAHLEHCPACRATARTLNLVRAHTRPVEEPDELLVNSVLRTLRNEAPATAAPAYPVLRPLAGATVLIVFFGIYFALIPPTTRRTSAPNEVISSSLQEEARNIMFQGFSEDDLAFDYILSGASSPLIN